MCFFSLTPTVMSSLDIEIKFAKMKYNPLSWVLKCVHNFLSWKAVEVSRGTSKLHSYSRHLILILIRYIQSRFILILGIGNLIGSHAFSNHTLWIYAFWYFSIIFYALNSAIYILWILKIQIFYWVPVWLISHPVFSRSDSIHLWFLKMSDHQFATDVSFYLLGTHCS